MAINRRADYQRLCAELKSSTDGEAKNRLRATILELVTEDEGYARGFIEDSLRRGLSYISSTVGNGEGRPFSIAAEVHELEGEPTVLVGLSFRPIVGDDLDDLIEEIGAEIQEIADIHGFDWLIGELAVNGRSVARV